MDTYKDAVLLNDLWDVGRPALARLGGGAGAVRALVTGARGFAGSWLAKALLEEGAEVTSIDRDGASPTGLELQGIAGDVERRRRRPA